MANCVYCGLGPCTREHVFSKSAMIVAFGNPIRNSMKTVQGKRLLDHEALIKDVCAQCNNVALSPYDNAGKELVSEIDLLTDPTSEWIKFDKSRLGWLIKTHLNCIRCVPSIQTKVHYRIDPDIYTSLREHRRIPPEKFALYIEGIQGKPGYFWGRGDDVKHRLQYFGFKSVEFRRQKILCSDLKIKCLNTYLFIPSDTNYTQFPERSQNAVEEMHRELGFDLQMINIDDTIRKGGFKVSKVMKYLDVRQHSHR